MKNFCSHPWIGLDISPQGQYRPCCKFDKPMGNSLDEYKSNPQLKLLKDTMEKDQRHPGCKRCWNDEDIGLISKRQIDYEYNLSDKPLDIYSNKIRFLSISFGNTCNLACRTCSSYSSSKWSSEINLHGNHYEQEWFKHNRFYKDPNFLSQTYNLIDEQAHIDIPGGEPFLTDILEHLTFLDLLQNRAKGISIHYTTNGTNFPSDSLINLWKNFKKIDIQISVDGTSKMFEYTRWPGKWEECYKNLQKYKQLVSQQTHINISISHTVSVFNVLDIPDFLVWCMKEKMPKPYLGMVYQPKEFSIRVFPTDIKQEITARLSHLGKHVSSVINFMNDEQIPSINYDNLLNKIEFLDRCRNQKLEEYCPKIADLIKKAH